MEDSKAPDHATLARFRTGRCREVVEDLFYQFANRLEEMGETDHKTVFIDGTKIESRAGRYTFVWRKSVEKQLAKVKQQVQEAASCTTAAELRRRQEDTAQKLCFMHGSGKRKRPEQKEWERLSRLLERWEKYENSLTVLGKARNSYVNEASLSHGIQIQIVWPGLALLFSFRGIYALFFCFSSFVPTKGRAAEFAFLRHVLEEALILPERPFAFWRALPGQRGNG